MKKFFPFAILGCLVSLNAFADCKLLSCDSFSWYEPNGWVRASVNGNQCWGCGPGPNSCRYHDVVPHVDGLGEVIALYQCTSGFKNSFESYNPGGFCAESQLQAARINSIDLTNAKKTYRLKGKATTATSLGDWNVFSGSAACIYVECNKGFVPNSNKTKCVVDTREATCTESSVRHGESGVCDSLGGDACLKTGDNTFLYCYTKDKLEALSEDFLPNSCIANKHRVIIPSHSKEYYECVPDDDGTWEAHYVEMCKSGSDFPDGCNGINGCEEQIVDASGNKVVVNASATVMNSEMTFCVRAVCKDGWVKSGEKCITQQAQQQAAATTEANKQKCVQSLGTWSGGKCNCDAAKNLVKDTNVSCRCKDANYEPNDTTKSCELKDSAIREQACKEAAQSGATWNGKECICDAAYKEWNDTQCVEMIEYTQCQGISDATWNVVAKECVCNDESKVINGAGTKCVESEETKQKREAATAQTAISAAVARLQSLTSDSDLEVSKWKTADGKFNTARLASDSIAGVVLGTAGGLITSNVVKKHQVEDGFEDLQCVIGGQTVAGWGDEFTVGVH